jgi:TetR/AcrR family transcriptional regulator, transcriptional repressor for nem operon
VVAAMARMFDEALAKFSHLTAGEPPATALGAHIDFYLSRGHRDARETGCPLPSLSADLLRLGTAARQRFTAGVAGLIAAIAGLLAALGRPDADILASSALAKWWARCRWRLAWRIGSSRTPFSKVPVTA